MKEESSIDEMWGKAEKSIKNISEEVLGFQGRKILNKWFNEKFRNAMLEKNDARTIMLRNPNKTNKWD